MIRHAQPYGFADKEKPLMDLKLDF